jgi:molybdopterin converting factor small subunit
LRFATAQQFELRAAEIDGTSEATEKNMAVKVIIPTPLRVYAAKRDSAEVSAQTVGEALGDLTSQFAELRKHLFTDDGKLRSFVNVYLNDEDIRYMAKEATPVKDGDVLSIVPSIAGGSGASDPELA